MAGPADEARQLVDQRTVQLAKLHWALQSHSTRVEVAMRWLDAIEAPPRASRASPAGDAELERAVANAPEPAAARPQVVLPPDDPAASDTGPRRLRVIVSESRQVSLEVEDTIPAPAPEIEPRHRLAS
jgi:hypothetical protein